MPNLISLKQIRQDEISGFYQIPLTSATGTLYTVITGQQITTGYFNSVYVKNTGNEPISGVKAFASRPTVFGTGILVSGEVYPLNSNPSGYTNFKVSGSANILTPNLTGVGGAQVILSGNFVLISGGAASSSVGGGGVSGIRTTGVFPSGVVSGLVTFSGAGTVGITTGVNGIIVISGLASAGSIGLSTLAATGNINTGYFTGDVLLSGAGNITVFTGNNANKLIVVSGNTGAYANFALSSATGQFITTAQTGLFSSTQVTGSAALAVVNLTGAGNVTVTTGGGTLVIFSGNTGAYANFITPSQTGQFITTAQTGIFATSENLQITGSNLQSQINSLGGSNTGQAIIFDSGIQQGVVRQSFNFPFVFNVPPYVVTQVKYLGNTGAGVPTVGVSGVTTSGFSGVYNIPFGTTGYTLTIYAASGAINPVSLTPTSAIRGISFFTPYVVTGETIQEAFVPAQISLTGYSIGCTSSGTYPIHLSSGASGALLWSPMTGRFYLRDQSNNTVTLFSWSFDSGVLYKNTGISSIVSGGYRLGLDIYSGLSGIKNVTWGMAGYI